MTRIFQIGETIYYATFGHTSRWITCPDCLGAKKLTCIMGDGTQVGVDCSLCSRGWEGSHGVVEQWDMAGETRKATITGVNNRVTDQGQEVEYITACSHYVKHENAFADEAEAKTRADALAKEYEADQNKRFLAKEKDGHTWAWHVRYHRREIVELEKRLVHHRAKLELSKMKAKEPSCDPSR